MLVSLCGETLVSLCVDILVSRVLLFIPVLSVVVLVVGCGCLQAKAANTISNAKNMFFIN